jgi:uncharacterized protein YgbK (DUF1537 family)
MIVAIADDFTGAAELAGISWRYGLITEVHTHLKRNVRSLDVLILDTNTRSKDVRETEEKMIQITRQLAATNFDLIYKKTDSVLRGHVLQELEILIQALGFKGALLVPANPSSHRIIKKGHYYIDGTPLNKTDFANDPEYPRRHSDISSLLAEAQVPDVRVLQVGNTLDEAGIQVGECQSDTDLEFWVSQLRETYIPAGASDFFNHILASKNYRPNPIFNRETFRHQIPMLIIVGSLSEKSLQSLIHYRELGIPICNPPGEIEEFQKIEQDLIMNWADQIINTLNKKEIVAISTKNLTIPGTINPSPVLTSILNSLIEKIYEKVEIRELVIEGGATASSIIRHLGWQSMIPVYEFEKGVVALRVSNGSGSLLVVKPGSYLWPDNFFEGIGVKL